jgi:retinaldehyde-binding protein 1
MASSEFVIQTGELCEESKAVAERELRETPENVKKGIEELKALIEGDETIFFDTSDDFLIIFLRPCKFYAKSAYELLKRIALFKENNKSILDNLMPDSEKDAFINHKVINILKNRDQKGRRVMIINSGALWDPKQISTDQLFRIVYLVHELAMLEPETQVNGVVFIQDFNGMSMKQVMAITPAFSVRLLTFIQDALPYRLKEVHIVKQPFIFNIVWNIFKPLMREKLKKRTFFHGTKMSSLHKHIAKTHLPKDYDGDLPAIDYSGAEWFPALTDYVDHIYKWNTYGLVKKDK